MNVTELRARLGDAIVEGDAAQAAGRLLSHESLGHLAVEGGGWPYVVPINFAYDGRAVRFHGGGSLKASLLEADPRVSLAVTTLPELMQGEGPCDDNFRYESVLVFGEVERLTDDAERDRGLARHRREVRPSGQGRAVQARHVQGHSGLFAEGRGADVQAESAALSRRAKPAGRASR